MNDYQLPSLMQIILWLAQSLEVSKSVVYLSNKMMFLEVMLTSKILATDEAPPYSFKQNDGKETLL